MLNWFKVHYNIIPLKKGKQHRVFYLKEHDNIILKIDDKCSDITILYQKTIYYYMSISNQEFIKQISRKKAQLIKPRLS